MLEVGDCDSRLNEPRQVLLRPRRFGKTLLLDTLETWFQGLPPERVDKHPRSDLYGDTMDTPAGWSSPAWLWEGLDGAAWHGTHGWHPVLRIDLAQYRYGLDLRDALRSVMLDAVRTWRRRGVEFAGLEAGTEDARGMCWHPS